MKMFNKVYINNTYSNKFTALKHLAYNDRDHKLFYIICKDDKKTFFDKKPVLKIVSFDTEITCKVCKKFMLNNKEVTWKIQKA